MKQRIGIIVLIVLPVIFLTAGCGKNRRDEAAEPVDIDWDASGVYRGALTDRYKDFNPDGKLITVEETCSVRAVVDTLHHVVEIEWVDVNTDTETATFSWRHPSFLEFSHEKRRITKDAGETKLTSRETRDGNKWEIEIQSPGHDIERFKMRHYLPDGTLNEYDERGVLGFKRGGDAAVARITTGFPPITKDTRIPHGGLSVDISDRKLKDLLYKGWAVEEIIYNPLPRAPLHVDFVPLQGLAINTAHPPNRGSGIEIKETTWDIEFTARRDGTATFKYSGRDRTYELRKQ